MKRLEWYVAAVVTVVLGLAVWGSFTLTHHVNAALDSVTNAGNAATAAATRINGPNGTIAMMDEDIGAAKSLIIHGDLVARHEQHQLTTWDARGAEVFNNVNGAVTDLRGTITAATGAVNATTATVQEGQRTIQAVQPVLGEARSTIADLHAAVPDVVRTAKGTADTVQHTAAVGADAEKVANHFEQAIDNPKIQPWYVRILPKVVQELIEVGFTYAASH